MKKVIALLCASVFTTSAYSADWFIAKNALTSTHQHLLEGDTDKAFTSLVEVWQNYPSTNRSEHLDQLLNKALEVDCGKGFSKGLLPAWLSSLVIRRQVVQSPGRLHHKLIVDAKSSSKLSLVSVLQWPEQVNIINAVPEVKEGKQVSDGQMRYVVQTEQLNQRLKSGLYKVVLETDSSQRWESWVVMAEPNVKESVRWDSKRTWITNKTGLLNEFCPLPVMTVSLYDVEDGEYHESWSEMFEKNYPVKLPDINLPADRYVLSVSLAQKRWQGNISIEDVQIIAKTIDWDEEVPNK